MDIRGIIFDADHTLYTPQSDAAYDAKFRFLAEETGIRKEALRQHWEERTEKNLQTSKPDVWERKQMIEETLNAVGIHPDDTLLEEAYSVFWETVVNNTEVDSGVTVLLHRLKDAGYPLAVATDEFPEPLRMKLETVIQDTAIDTFFDMIITPRDTGEQKPSTKFYEPIVDEFGGIADEYMMVGDSWVRDLKPAQDMGMITVLAGDSDPHGDPDHEIDSVTELEDVLEQVAAR